MVIALLATYRPFPSLTDQIMMRLRPGGGRAVTAIRVPPVYVRRRHTEAPLGKACHPSDPVGNRRCGPGRPPPPLILPGRRR